MAAVLLATMRSCYVHARRRLVAWYGTLYGGAKFGLVDVIYVCILKKTNLVASIF